MDPRCIQALADLLTGAEAAHGAYETTELGGVYDQAWPAWYASYAVEHGVDVPLGETVTADELAMLLTRGWDAWQRTDPKPTEAWASWTARWLLTARA